MCVVLAIIRPTPKKTTLISSKDGYLLTYVLLLHFDVLIDVLLLYSPFNYTGIYYYAMKELNSSSFFRHFNAPWQPTGRNGSVAIHLSGAKHRTLVRDQDDAFWWE